MNDSSAPPKVSWLLCTNTYDRYLNDAIESCLNQTFREFELVIVVNGDKYLDYSRLIAKRYIGDSRVRVLATPFRHLPFSLNLGLQFARAEFVARMDADDIAEPTRLEKQFLFMTENAEAAVLGTAAACINERNEIVGYRYPPLSHERIRKVLPFKNPIIHPSVMLRKQAVVDVGGYPMCRYAEDYCLWLRLLTETNWKFANLSVPLLKYRQKESGPARRSREAYLNSSIELLRSFFMTRSSRYLLGSLLFACKAIIRAKRA